MPDKCYDAGKRLNEECISLYDGEIVAHGLTKPQQDCWNMLEIAGHIPKTMHNRNVKDSLLLSHICSIKILLLLC